MDAHDCYEDEVFITLIPLHHLKDWLPEAIRQQANDHIDAHESLQICADLANAAKHAWLNPKKGGKRARVDVGPGAPLIHLSVSLARKPSPLPPARSEVRIRIERDGQASQQNAVELIRTCFNLSRQFIDERVAAGELDYVEYKSIWINDGGHLRARNRDDR